MINFKFNLKQQVFFVLNGIPHTSVIVARKYFDIIDNGNVITYQMNNNSIVLESELFSSPQELESFLNQRKESLLEQATL